MDKTDISAFITVHDQDLIIEAEAEHRFAMLPNYTYVFVGHSPVNKLSDCSCNVIIARDCSFNIEIHRHLYCFTHWYCTVHNDLLRSTHILSLHYDMFPRPGLLDAINERHSTAGCLDNLIGLFAAPMRPHFADSIQIRDTFCQALAIKGLTLDDIYSLDRSGKFACGNAIATSSATLRHFIHWFEELLDLLVPHWYCGHIAERMIKVYCLLHGKEDYVLGLADHTCEDSHRTSRRLTWG